MYGINIRLVELARASMSGQSASRSARVLVLYVGVLQLCVGLVACILRVLLALYFGVLQWRGAVGEAPIITLGRTARLLPRSNDPQGRRRIHRWKVIIWPPAWVGGPTGPRCLGSNSKFCF